MKRTSKITTWIVGALVALLSCCVIGAGVAMANSSSNGENVGEKYAPDITIDYGEFSSDNVPNAVINKSYKLFTATAEDLYSKRVYTHTRVWLFYDSTSRSLVNVENGCVTPTSYGVYTVEFTAVDRWGNVSTKLYDFECAEKDALKVEVGQSTAEYKAGYAIKVNDGEIVNAIGDTTLSVKATLKSNSSISYPVVNGEFTPLYAGTYDVIYTVSDYNETSESSYQVEVKAHDTPVWQDQLYIGGYYFIDYEYTLDEIKAYSFADGTPKDAVVSISVSAPSKPSTVLGEDRKFKPTVEGKHTITYKAEANGKTEVMQATVNTLDVGYATAINAENYFVGENVQKSSNDGAIILTTKTDNTNVRFANNINARKVRIDLSVVKESANHFASFDIILTDVKDSSKSITINFAKNGEKNGLLTASGGRKTKTDANFYNDGTLTFIYDNVKKEVSLNDKSVVAVVETTDGKNFDGFTNEEVFINIRFNGVVETAKIRVHRIGNSPLFKNCGDQVVPDVIYSRYLGGDASVGDIITIDRVYIYDVLSPKCEVSYYVMTPSKQYAVDVNGVELSPKNTDYTKDYQIKIEEFGRYTVYISAKDAFGRTNSISYPINSVNSQSIKIEIIDDQKTTAKLGDTVKVKSIEVPGYNLSDLSVRIFIMTPDRIAQQVTEGEFIVNLPGEYEVWYYVTDVDENLDMAHYTVTVS